MLSLLEVFSRLRKKGFPLAKTLVVESEKDLDKIDFPYFMKVNISGHKLKSGCVRKINNVNEAKDYYSELKKKFKEKIIIQELISGVQMVIGLKENRVFGKMLMIGFGGSSVEEKKDIAFRAVPVSREEIIEAVKNLDNYKLIKNMEEGIDKFVDLAIQVSEMDFKELDLNPVFVLEDKVVVVDGRGRL